MDSIRLHFVVFPSILLLLLLMADHGAFDQEDSQPNATGEFAQGSSTTKMTSSKSKVDRTRRSDKAADDDDDDDDRAFLQRSLIDGNATTMDVAVVVIKKLSFVNIKKFVHEHNGHRMNARPPSSDMVFMAWSLVLQRGAQKFVSTCEARRTLPDADRAFLAYWFTATDVNIWYESATKKFDVANVVHTWTAEESNNHSYRENICHDHICKSYNQIIASNIGKFGCQLKFCPTFQLKEETLSHYYYVACIYGHSERNLAHEKENALFYYEGVPCTKCPSGYYNCRDGLCHTIPVCDMVVDCNNVVDEDECLCEYSVYVDRASAAVRRRPSKALLSLCAALLVSSLRFLCARIQL